MRQGWGRIARGWRIAAVAIGSTIATLLIAGFLLLSFGWGLLRGTVERRLSASTGREVHIASIVRVGPVSLSPVLELRGIRVAQPRWAGAGDMLRMAAGRIRLPVMPLLVGHVSPQAIAMEGLRLALVRDAEGRANWEREHEAPSGAGAPDFGHMTLRDGAVSLDDAVRDRHFRVGIAIDDRGLRAAGTGSIAGSPATLRLTGPSVAEQREWPFDLRVESGIVSAHLAARSRLPLDIGHFKGRLEAHGRDLRDLDRLAEAGLFATQPFRFAADIQHDRPSWKITSLKGMVGRSDVAANITVHKEGERTLLDGDITSNGFDFDDLASNDGLAQAAADLKRSGPRFFPATRIDLSKLRKLDGTLRFDLRRLLFKEPSLVRSLRGKAVLDHGILTASPLVATLEHGRVSGSAMIRHQSGAPLLTLDLTLAGSRMEGLLTQPEMATGPLAGRLRLHGYGETVRAAMARSSGTVGIAVRDGRMNRRAALAIGTDVGRALFGDKTESTPLRCIVARFDVRGGIARPNPLILDTPVARGAGSGLVRLSDERLAMEMRGQPKLKGGLRYDGAIRVDGTIKRPHITPPPGAVTAHGILKSLGNAIGGKPVALAADADCGGLAARALR